MYFLIYQGRPGSFHRGFINSPGPTGIFWHMMAKGFKSTMALKAQQLAAWHLLCVAGSFIYRLGCGASLESWICPGLVLKCQSHPCLGLGELFCLGRPRRGVPVPVPGASSQAAAKEPQAPVPQAILKPDSAASFCSSCDMVFSGVKLPQDSCGSN